MANTPPFARSAIIVCEPTPYWMPELQRQFEATGIAVKGCRKWSEIAALSLGFVRSVEVVDLNISAADVLTGLARRVRQPSPRPLIALLPPSLAELEWRLREAAVQAVFIDLVPGENLARTCRRWLGEL